MQMAILVPPHPSLVCIGKAYTSDQLISREVKLQNADADFLCNHTVLALLKCDFSAITLSEIIAEDVGAVLA